MPSKPNTATILHRQLYFQEVWALDQQIEAVAGLAKYALGSDLRRAVDKLAHLVQARNIWLSRLSDAPRPEEIFPDDWSLDDLREASRTSQERWGAYLDALDDAELARVVSYAASSGTGYANAVEDILLHVWSHGYYHRGQVGMLINSMGGTPPAIDYIVHRRVIAGE